MFSREALKLYQIISFTTKRQTSNFSKELGFISEENYKNIRFEVESITNKINALRNHFLKS